MAPATRDRILDAALKAFATRGVDGTPITDLEQAAGLAPGSGGYYRYFRTKDDALAAVVRREIDRVLAGQRTDSDGVPDEEPHVAVAHLLEGGLETLRSLGPLMAILAREQGRIPELATEVAERLLEGGLRHDSDRLASTFGDQAPGDVRALGAVIISALVGYTLANDYFGSPPGGVDQDRFVATLAQLIAPEASP